MRCPDPTTALAYSAVRLLLARSRKLATVRFSKCATGYNAFGRGRRLPYVALRSRYFVRRPCARYSVRSAPCSDAHQHAWRAA